MIMGIIVSQVWYKTTSQKLSYLFYPLPIVIDKKTMQNGYIQSVYIHLQK